MVWGFEVEHITTEDSHNLVDSFPNRIWTNHDALTQLQITHGRGNVIND
jgi:hypothetical protein